MASHPIDIHIGLPARDQLRLRGTLDAEKAHLLDFQLSGVGCPTFLQRLVSVRQQLRDGIAEGSGSLKINEIHLPSGEDHAAMLFRELILKLRDQWLPPYRDEEICHCRSVPTARVDRAIVCGNHTIQQVARETSAGTSCGTCRTDTEALIRYRLTGA